jgi:hypothetical protein
LKEITAKTPVKLKIRYGRQSQSREDTYTMILSNHPTTGFGQGFILGFKAEIKNFRMLKSQAFALAGAEGLWGVEPSLNKSWGTVGLLVNPNVDSKNKKNADLIRKKWAELYQNYKGTFNPKKYCIENENSVIDKDGFLCLDWTKEMDGYDFLIAIAVVPNIKAPLTAKQIAEKMMEKNYTEYFDNNRTSEIFTFQDDEIEQLLALK